MFAMGPAFFKQATASYATLALTGTFASATVGVAYSSSLAITGGLAPYSLTGGTGVASGTLPAGLSLSISGSNLVLSGTPTTAATSAFTASVDSSDGQTATSAQSVTVAPSALQSAYSTANKAADIVLSDSNTTATSNKADETGGMVLSASGKSSGKYYVEAMQIKVGGFDASNFGLHSGISGLSVQVGDDAQGWGSLKYGAGGGTGAKYHSATIASSTSIATGSGQTVRLAVDITAGKLWLSYYGTAGWIGGGDPSLGTSPTFTFTPSGDYYFAACPRSSSQQLKIVSPGSWLYPAPAGFGVWTA